MTAMTRELTHTSIGPVAVGNFTFHLPPVGPVLIVLSNIVVLMVFCFYKLNTTDEWAWEDVGYRTGFISIAQLPLIFLLAGKNNIIGLLTGSSYERLNWLHRWVARTLWLTATIHMCFWFRSWARYDYIVTKLLTDKPTQTGFSTWCILTFTVITSMYPVRRMSYELFVVSHLLTMAGFLAAIWFHAPNEVKVWVWIPIGLLVFDRVCRFLSMAYTNLTLLHPNSKGSGRAGWANAATFTALPGNVTKVTVPDPVFSWKPGQHAFISCHSILPFQSHPFSITSIPSDRCLEFIVRAERGGTRKLFTYASKKHAVLGEGPSVTRNEAKLVTIDGPYGRIRNLRQFDSVMFISGGMGVTFTMPLMRDIVEGWKNEHNENRSRSPFRAPSLVKRVRFIWVIRAQSQLSWFADRIQQLMQDVESCSQTDPTFDKQLEISIYITCDTELSSDPITSFFPQKPQQQTPISPPEDVKVVDIQEVEKLGDSASDEDQATGCLPGGGCCCTSKATDLNKPSAPCNCSGPTPDDEATTITNPQPNPQVNTIQEKTPSTSTSTLPSDRPQPQIIRIRSGRPDVRERIRSVLEEAEGESAVVACGPRGLNADTRQSVVGLSDERAVHKGTGAQGVYLHVEQFAF